MIFNPLGLFNMLRGQGVIPHWAWLVLAGITIYGQTQNFYTTALWMWIIVVTTIFETWPLLDCADGDKGAMRLAFMRNLLIFPAAICLHSLPVFILMLQGPLYWAVGRLWRDGRSIRASEGITGQVIGWLI